jgi:hypothetical protein
MIATVLYFSSYFLMLREEKISDCFFVFSEIIWYFHVMVVALLEWRVTEMATITFPDFLTSYLYDYVAGWLRRSLPAESDDGN